MFIGLKVLWTDWYLLCFFCLFANLTWYWSNSGLHPESGMMGLNDQYSNLCIFNAVYVWVYLAFVVNVWISVVAVDSVLFLTSLGCILSKLSFVWCSLEVLFYFLCFQHTLKDKDMNGCVVDWWFLLLAAIMLLMGCRTGHYFWKSDHKWDVLLVKGWCHSGLASNLIYCW